MNLTKSFKSIVFILLALFFGANYSFGQIPVDGIDPDNPATWFYVNLTAQPSTPACGANPGQVWLHSVTPSGDDSNPYVLPEKPANPYSEKGTDDWDYRQWSEEYGFTDGMNDAKNGLSEKSYPSYYDDPGWTNAVKEGYDAGWDWYKSGHYLNPENPVGFASTVSLKGYTVVYAPGFDDLMGFSSYASFYGKAQENDGWYFTGWSFTDGDNDLGVGDENGTLFRILPAATAGEANIRNEYVYATFKPVLVSDYKVNGLINTSVSNSTTVVFDAVGESVSTADFTVSSPEANFTAEITSCENNKVIVTVTYSGAANGEFRGNVTLASKSGCSQLTAPVYARVGADATSEATLYDGKTPTFSADTTNAHLKWKYTDGSNNWQDLNFAVSGEVGPEGFSPAVSIDDTETGKHKVTITDKTHPSQGQTFTVLDGEDGTDGAKGADACPISAKSTEITNGHNVKIFYTSATNPDTNPLADFNVMDGEDGHGSSDVFDDTTISGNGSQETPYGVDTNVLATHTWVENKHYIANVTVNTTAFSGDGTSQSPLDLKINNPNSNKKYGYQPGTGWTEISEGGTVYDIIGNNGISAKKDTANDRYEVGLSGSYLPTLGGTVSGQLILSAATGTFDNSYIKCINNANVGNAIFGLGSQGGAIIKTVDGNNNSVQVNVNAGSDNSQLINVKTNNGITNVGYLIPAMVEQAGWTPSTDDKILHIVLES